MDLGFLNSLDFISREPSLIKRRCGATNAFLSVHKMIERLTKPFGRPFIFFWMAIIFSRDSWVFLDEMRWSDTLRIWFSASFKSGSWAEVVPVWSTKALACCSYCCSRFDGTVKKKSISFGFPDLALHSYMWVEGRERRTHFQKHDKVLLLLGFANNLQYVVEVVHVIAIHFKHRRHGFHHHT